MKSFVKYQKCQKVQNKIKLYPTYLLSTENKFLNQLTIVLVDDNFPRPHLNNFTVGNRLNGAGSVVPSSK